MKAQINLLNAGKTVILIIAVMLAGCASMNQSKTEKPWRCAWLGWRNIDNAIKKAKAADFNAVVFFWNKKRTPPVIKKAQKLGLESYVWIYPPFPKGDRKKYLQKMSKNETAALQHEKELSRQKRLYLDGYQGGGEPLPGRTEVLLNPMPCFHKGEVVAATKQQVKEILKTVPHITGIALDMFGYQNYHCCYCAASKTAFEEYCKRHNLPRNDAAWQKFSLDTLVDFQNEICRYARSLKPDIKITCHVWPVYSPLPLYGNRLNIDYCAQTAAWFFLPHWNDKKIAHYTKTIVNAAKKYHKRQQGIPFLGYFNPTHSRHQGTKSAERLKHELEVIFANEPVKSISIYNFSELAGNPAAFAALMSALEKKQDNLLKYPVTKDGDGDGFPDHYELKNGKRKSLSIVTEDGTPALKFQADQYRYVRIRSPYQKFAPDSKYVMKFQVKVKNLDAKKHSKQWAGNGLRVDIHNSNNIYKFAVIMGFKADSNGWITAVVPFDTGKQPAMVKSRIMIFFFNISGTVWIRNITIEKVRDGEYKNCFIMPDGKQVMTKYLQL